MTHAPKSFCRRNWEWLLPIALYGVQLVILAFCIVFPLVDVENATHRYVISHYSSNANLIPGLGLVPLLMGHPVRFVLTDKSTGQIKVTIEDLASDVAYDYPTVARALSGR